MGERMPVRITRWPGKPTSGRSVYREARGRLWWWQCDLHGDDASCWGARFTWRESIDEALAHAAVCPFIAVPSRDVKPSAVTP